MAPIRILCALAIFAVLVLAIGCGGGTTAPTAPGPNSAATNFYAISRAPDTDQTSASHIVEFPTTTSGNVTPTASISVDLTASQSLDELALDPTGNIYVTTHDGQFQRSGPYQATVRIYSPTASGTATPQRVIAGNAPGLKYPYGIAVDNTGQIYVTQEPGGQGLVLPAVSVFAANANGNVPPLKTITGDATTLVYPGSPTFDSANNLYVSNTVGYSNGPPDTVVEFAAGASGNVAPIRTITGSATTFTQIESMTLDSSGAIYISSSAPSTNSGGYTGSIFVFSPNAQGNATPVRVITGDATMLHLVGAIRVDSKGAIFVSSYAIATLDETPRIFEFAPGANGNAAPIATITATVFGQPIGDFTIH